MAVLNDEHKAFIMRRYAAFRTPQQVADDVAAEFGITIDRFQARDYDPKARRKRPLAQRWLELFKIERAAYIKETTDIPVAHRAHRLRVLNELIDKELAKARPNPQLIASLMEQSAKECGDSFTNRVNLNHSGKVNVSMSADERAAKIAQLLAKATVGPETVKAE